MVIIVPLAMIQYPWQKMIVPMITGKIFQNVVMALVYRFASDYASGLVSDDINFDSTDLDQVATDIRTELAAGGYLDVDVTVLRDQDPYRFHIEYDVSSGGQRIPSEVIGDVQLHYVPNADTPLPATVTLIDQTTDLMTFRLNTFTTNEQTEPTVGMDDDGNFMVAWAGNGQDISFLDGLDTKLKDGDEVMIFPPVSGG